MHLKANQVPGFGDLTNVSVEKLQELETVLQRILALPIARDTYAQILDGTPTRTPFSDEIKETGSTFYKTIIDSNKTTPTDKAMQKYEEIRSNIAPQDLVIDLKLAQNYQDAPSGSRENHLRLLEIAAASVHSLAGMIYVSKHEDMNFKPPEPPGGHLHYPFGLLNVVGYWAEAELFGGVVLFERGEGGSGVTNAFLYPQRASCAFQLSEKQLQDFADLSRASDADGSVDVDALLPFSKELNARIEPTFVSVGEAPLRIYKNEYDKHPVSFIPKRPSCVITEDDPRGASMKEVMKAIKEKGWDSRSFQTQPSLWSADLNPEEASSSSKNGGNKEDK